MKGLHTTQSKALVVLGIVAFLIILGRVLTKAQLIPDFFHIGQSEEQDPIQDNMREDDTTGSHKDGFEKGGVPMKVDKPVIYLYPENVQDVHVRLDYDGDIFAHYPDYDERIDGWKVTASPDGTLINHADQLEYSYLFREGIPAQQTDRDLSEGFVVRGEDTKAFLQKTLATMGLTPREYNEFIVYWFPLMQDNPYNLIHFAHEQYTDTAPLTITPQQDSMLRVFMVFKPLDKEIVITPQQLSTFERVGFSVIEWGGTEVR